MEKKVCIQEVLPSEVIEKIVMKIVDEYEQRGINNAMYITGHLLSLAQVNKAFLGMIQKTILPYFSSKIESDLPENIPWDDIVSRPHSAYLKDIKRAYKWLHEMHSINKNTKESKMIDAIFDEFGIERRSMFPSKILYEINEERYTGLQYIYENRDEIYGIVNILFYIGVKDKNIGILAKALTGSQLEGFREHGINCIQDLKHAVQELKKYLPDNWDFRQSGFHIMKKRNMMYNRLCFVRFQRRHYRFDRFNRLDTYRTTLNDIYNIEREKWRDVYPDGEQAE